MKTRLIIILLCVIVSACGTHHPDCSWEVVASYEISNLETGFTTISSDVEAYSTPPDVRTPELVMYVADESGECSITGSGEGYAAYECTVTVPTSASYTVTYSVNGDETEDSVIDSGNHSSRHKVSAD